MSIDLGFIGAMKQAEAQKNATSMQMRAIKEQRKYLYENLDPNVIGAKALEFDQSRAANQLELLKKLYPSLAAASEKGQAAMDAEMSRLGIKSGQVADMAQQEATAAGPMDTAAKNALIDAAMAQLKQGATLPPDVQAELVQSGLESSGMATGRSTAQGMGGTMLRTILGSAGLRLQMERQAKAESLLQSASALEANRQNVLQSLFPRLASLQSANLAMGAGALNAAQAATPQAGLSGTDVANIWLARVGASNSLTQQAANAQAANALAQGSIWSSAMGSVGVNANQAIDIAKRINAGSGSSVNPNGTPYSSPDAGADYGGELDTAGAGMDFAG